MLILGEGKHVVVHGYSVAPDRSSHLRYHTQNTKPRICLYKKYIPGEYWGYANRRKHYFNSLNSNKVGRKAVMQCYGNVISLISMHKIF